MLTSVYVHFPWCLQKCPYCDFASATIRRSEVPHTAYADALLQELERRAKDRELGTLASVFFGGGTPSLWEAAELARVLQAVHEAFRAKPGSVEVTVECNPSSLDRAKAAALCNVGVNRVSIGVQSLDDTRLRFLGRLHDAEGALRAVRDALLELPRVSADLMFGMPGQRAPDFLDELSRLLQLGLSHLSVYALTVEAQTQFGELYRKGKLTLAKEDDYADTFLATERALAERGFSHYEVSNYALAGQTSVHNQHYWRGGDYLGLGAAAVGCQWLGLGRARRYRNDPNPLRYMELCASQSIEVFEEMLDGQAIVREGLMLGLRTDAGVLVPELEARAGVMLREGRQRELERALQGGNVVLQGDRLVVPHERWLHLDSIVAALF